MITIGTIIHKKKHGQPLTKEEIDYFVEGYTQGQLSDYQISALLMAIYFQGMTEEETLDLTLSMMNSGEVLNFSSIGNVTIDKHSTGGIGDKTSLIVAPMWNSEGLSVAKMSGRGLGFTGGTIDKMESIPKLRVQLTYEEFLSQVKEYGIAMTAQSKNLVPADKKLYALRDVTETVDSIPLIASSVMSKKLATGSDVLVLDVKYGRGAFMKDYQSAKELAVAMVKIGEAMKRKVGAILSPMDYPLGYAVGNALEIFEVLEILDGRGHGELRKEALAIGGVGFFLSGIVKTIAEGVEKAKESLDSHKAKEAFYQFVRIQGGKVPNDDFKKAMHLSKNALEVKAKKDGYIVDINALSIGMLSMQVGAGRKEIGDTIDHGAGVQLNVTIGDFVKKGDLLATLYSDLPIREIQEKLFDYGESIVIGAENRDVTLSCDLIYEDKIIDLNKYL